MDLKIVKRLDIFTIIFPIFKICIKWKFNKIDRRERNEKEINIFTGYDIKKLWDNIKIDWVEYILIMIYTGMRIGEAVNLKKENVDLINGIIFGGNKTEKGKHRQTYTQGYISASERAI